MHDSVAQEPPPDGDDRIVIYQSTDREGSTFSLSPETRRMLERRFGAKFHVSPRIFVAHDTGDAFRRLHGNFSRQLLALLTGLEDSALDDAGDLEFRDPVTDRRL
jgi:hypothetical protein